MPVFSKSLGIMDYSSPEAIKAIANHIRVMQEELEYRLSVLDSSNINEINADQTSIVTKNGNLIEIINETDKSIAKLNMTDEEIALSVENANDNISEIKQYAESITLSVSNGETSSTLTLKAGETVLTSQSITFNGVVTFKGLQEGTTTIDGACIKTGTISADRLSLTGAITFEDLADDAKTAIDNAAPKYQYSVNGSSAWHNEMLTTDYYRRESTDGGATWGAAYQFRGTNGKDGSDANVPSYITSTKITKTTIESPAISGGSISGTDIFGGTFWDIQGKVKLTLNGNNFGYGDMYLRNVDNDTVLAVLDNIDYTSLFGRGVEVLRISAATGATHPIGEWNFGAATVSGLHLTFS